MTEFKVKFSQKVMPAENCPCGADITDEEFERRFKEAQKKDGAVRLSLTAYITPAREKFNR
jgi:hypothetical protein